MAIRILKKNIEAELLVDSESTEGAFYMVQLNEHGWGCSCLDHQTRKHDCKHIKEAREVIKYD